MGVRLWWETGYLHHFTEFLNKIHMNHKEENKNSRETGDTTFSKWSKLTSAVMRQTLWISWYGILRKAHHFRGICVIIHKVKVIMRKHQANSGKIWCQLSELRTRRAQFCSTILSPDGTVHAQGSFLKEYFILYRCLCQKIGMF